MQAIVIWFLALALPHVMTTTMVDSADSMVEGDAVVKKHVVVQKVVGDREGQFTVTINTGDGDGATRVIDLADGGQGQVVFVANGGADGQVITKTIQINTEDNTADRGWLGVSIGKVPDALATQLNISKDGLAVVNVVDGGPADNAGIRTHDVIVSIDGETVSSDFGKLKSLLADRKPGDRVEVVVLQDGQEKAFEIELGSKADVSNHTWKFDATINLGEVEELVHTSGKMMIRDENGEWKVIDLGDLPALEALELLPENVRLAIPKSVNQSTQVFFSDGQQTVKSTVTRDGQSVSVSQADGGDIVVTRMDIDGNETGATYATVEDLEAGDLEAFDIFSKAGKTVVMKLDIDGDFTFPDAVDVDIDLGEDFDIDTMKNRVMVWRQNLDDALGDADEVREQMQEQLEAMLQELREGNGDGLAQLKILHTLDGKGLHQMPLGQLRGQVQQSFEVRPNGTIAVTVRKGDSQVVNVYTGEDDLANRSPELYAKYLKVVGDGD